MLLDNQTQLPKVHEWIADETRNGKMDIVTGYFTIGALAWLSKKTNEKINDRDTAYFLFLEFLSSTLAVTNPICSIPISFILPITPIAVP